MLSNVKAGGPYVMKIEKDCRHLLFELVPLPIINIVFGGHSHTERRPDSASTRPIKQDSLSMTVRAESKCPMLKIQDFFWETALANSTERKI